MTGKLQTALLYITLAVTGVCLYKEAASLAYATRGYHATGGEIFLLALPLLYWLIDTTVKDWVRLMKDMPPEEEGDTL